MHKYFAIIPARKGSKEIKNKNLQKIGSKPLIMWTIDYAKKTNLIDLTIVSTDDERIIKLSKKYNFFAPFLRPKKYSTDKATMTGVINHSLTWYKSFYKSLPQNIILLQPTSPFRNSIDINNAISKFEKDNKKSLVSITEVTQHPNEMVSITKKNKLKRIKTKDKLFGSRHFYSKYYFIDGGIYISDTKRFLMKQSMHDTNSSYLIIDKAHGIDINDNFDLLISRKISNYT